MSSKDTTNPSIALSGASTFQPNTDTMCDIYMCCNEHDQATDSNNTSFQTDIAFTTAFAAYPGANKPYTDGSNPSDADTSNPAINAFTTLTRHRANSSISMSDVPSFMSEGQILSPEGLQATLQLFHIDNDQEEIYLHSHREESGGTPVKANGKRGRHESDVDGEFAAIDHYHINGADTNSEGSVHGDLKVIEDDALSVDEFTDDDTVSTESRNGSDSDDDTTGQGGAPLYSRPTTGGLRLPTKKAAKMPMTVVMFNSESCESSESSESSESESESEEDYEEDYCEVYEEAYMRRQREREQERRKTLDVPAPFPKFDECIAAMLHATGGVHFMIPIVPATEEQLNYPHPLLRARR